MSIFVNIILVIQLNLRKKPCASLSFTLLNSILNSALTSVSLLNSESFLINGSIPLNFPFKNKSESEKEPNIKLSVVKKYTPKLSPLRTEPKGMDSMSLLEI